MKLDNKDDSIQKLYKAQKLTLYCLLGLIYSAFIGSQLGRIQTIADFNYNLHEIMYAPFTLAIFFLPILFPVYIYLLIKYLLKRGKQKTNFKKISKATLIATSIIVIFSITLYQSFEVYTSGVFKVEQKLNENKKYYLVIDDKKVKISNNEFELIEANQEYLIGFVWNKQTPNKGKLLTIERLN